MCIRLGSLYLSLMCIFKAIAIYEVKQDWIQKQFHKTLHNSWEAMNVSKHA